MFPYMTDEISLASYSFHKLLEEGMIDVYGYLESLRYRYHLQLADIWNGFLDGMDIDDFKKIRRAMDDRGVRLASLCVDGAHPWSDDREELERNNRLAEKMLRCAEILGAATVRFDIGVERDEITEAEFSYIAGKFAEYAKRGAECGFVVGPENHWGASTRIDVQQRLYREIGSPGYGMLLHAGNWTLRESETLEGNNLLAAPMAAHTHIDYQTSAAADDLFPALREAGYKGVWSVEHHVGVNEYEGVQAQLGRVRYALSKQRPA